jgi:RimJ/RimL family protein N-acetyltransferase
LETARLQLRPFSPGDLEGLYAFHSLAEVARFLYWEARDLEQVRQVLDAKRRQTVLEDEAQVLALAVELRDTGVVVGEVSLRWLSRRHRQGEIGFVFHPGYQARGWPPRRPRWCWGWGSTGWDCTGSSAAATPSTSRRRS